MLPILRSCCLPRGAQPSTLATIMQPWCATSSIKYPIFMRQKLATNCALAMVYGLFESVRGRLRRSDRSS
jgi:hypothetical protein